MKNKETIILVAIGLIAISLFGDFIVNLMNKGTTSQREIELMLENERLSTQIITLETQDHEKAEKIEAIQFIIDSDTITEHNTTRSERDSIRAILNPM